MAPLYHAVALDQFLEFFRGQEAEAGMVGHLEDGAGRVSETFLRRHARRLIN